MKSLFVYLWLLAVISITNLSGASFDAGPHHNNSYDRYLQWQAHSQMVMHSHNSNVWLNNEQCYGVCNAAHNTTFQPQACSVSGDFNDTEIEPCACANACRWR
ncbi:MAG: hypothetical protein WC707_03230 [Candidatus Babeliaceae bacterium]